MSIPERPAIGEVTQFRRGDGKIVACLVVRHFDADGIYINYRKDDGEVIHDAIISVFDLVSDEEAALGRPVHDAA